MIPKRIELEKEKLTKWDGRFPTYFMGGTNSQPDLLLQMPPLEVRPKTERTKAETVSK